jgi:hypothetical protein
MYKPSRLIRQEKNVLSTEKNVRVATTRETCGDRRQCFEKFEKYPEILPDLQFHAMSDNMKV